MNAVVDGHQFLVLSSCLSMHYCHFVVVIIVVLAPHLYLSSAFLNDAFCDVELLCGSDWFPSFIFHFDWCVTF